jgi:signal transduction histidine kinase
MVVRDNGKGFYQLSGAEPSGTEYLGGNGIKNMYARANEIQATLNVRSAINEGTTITLTIPI